MVPINADGFEALYVAAARFYFLRSKGKVEGAMSDLWSPSTCAWLSELHAGLALPSSGNGDIHLNPQSPALRPQGQG
jgi:hypothetical protein